MRTAVASASVAIALGIAALGACSTPAWAQQPAPIVQPQGAAPNALPAPITPVTPPVPGPRPAPVRGGDPGTSGPARAPQPPAPATSATPGATPSLRGPSGPGPVGDGTASGAFPDTGVSTMPTRDLIQAHEGGLTADQVGARAAATSWSARASEEGLRSAAARVDEAWAAFLPRLSGIARYTRLSDFTPPSFPLGPPGFSGVQCPTPPAGPDGKYAINGGLPPGCVAPPVNFAFPNVVDQFLLQGTITVPISDYLFRIDQSYTAATRSQDAARYDVVTARSTAAANGKAAYYTWLRARGAVVVALLAIDDQKTHLRDAQNQFNVGNASRADVLRAETAVASAELALEQAKNLADLSEKQVHVAMHIEGDAPLLPGEDLEATPAPVQGDLKQMTAEALKERPEIKSADANAEAAREQYAASKAAYYPVISGFADGIVANPNSRYVPAMQVTHSTWDVGAQLTWSPNDAIVAGGSAADAETRVATILANKQTTRDNIDVEVLQSYQNVHQADFSIQTGMRELASAQEAYRVARELFNNGRGTSTTLTDAETDLTRARLDLLNAKADARIARVRLDHSLGRDAH